MAKVRSLRSDNDAREQKADIGNGVV